MARLAARWEEAPSQLQSKLPPRMARPEQELNEVLAQSLQVLLE